MMVAFRTQGRAVFLHGFAKNERENIDPEELLSLRDIAAGWLSADMKKIALAIAEGVLLEVYDDDDEP